MGRFTSRHTSSGHPNILSQASSKKRRFFPRRWYQPHAYNHQAEAENKTGKHFLKSPCICFDLENHKDLKIAEVFQAKIGGKLIALCVLDSKVDTLVNSLKEVLLSTAQELLGKKRKEIQPWVTNEVLDLCN